MTCSAMYSQVICEIWTPEDQAALLKGSCRLQFHHLCSLFQVCARHCIPDGKKKKKIYFCKVISNEGFCGQRFKVEWFVISFPLVICNQFNQGAMNLLMDSLTTCHREG